MKKASIYLVVLSLLSFGKPAVANTTLDLPGLGALDLTNFISNAGIMYAYDNHGTSWTGATVRTLWYPNDPTNAQNPAENAWLGLEAGLLWQPSTGKPSGAVGWVNLRADTLGAKIFGPSPKVGHLAIPAIEFGPMGGYLTSQKEWIWGGAVAKHF